MHVQRCTFHPQTNENAPPPVSTSGAAVSRGRGTSSPPSQRAATVPGAPSQKSVATAVPEVARRPRRSSAPVVIRGLGRHLELQEAAKRKKGLAEERAAEVFSVKKSALEGRAGLYTVPQPFALSTDQRRRCVQQCVYHRTLCSRCLKRSNSHASFNAATSITK